MRLHFEIKSFNIKPLFMANPKFVIILNFIFEHFTVMKQIHTFGACRVFENVTVLKHFEHMSSFGTCRDFATFLRFESRYLLAFTQFCIKPKIPNLLVFD